MVLVHDEGPRSLWKLARVVEPIKGHDGIVRVAKIQLAGTITTRPIVKLYPLEEYTEMSAEAETEVPESEGTTVGVTRPRRLAAVKSTEGWKTAIREGVL